MLLGRELRRRARMKVELARPSCTDALSGLANNRRFEEALGRTCKEVGRDGRPLSLLVDRCEPF